MSVHITREWQNVSGGFRTVDIALADHPNALGGWQRTIEARRRIAPARPSPGDEGELFAIGTQNRRIPVGLGKWLWLKTPVGGTKFDVVVNPTAETGPPFAPLDSPVFVGDPQAPTPPLGDNDTSIATTAFVQSELKSDFPSVEDWRGSGGDSTDTGTLRNAIAAAKAAGGMRLRMPARFYTIEQTLLIDASHIHLIGEGAGFQRASLASVQASPRTAIIWNGTVGGTIVRFNTPAGMERQIGGGIQGIQLDGNSFRAARGLHLESWVWGVFRDIQVFACSESQFRFEVVNYALLTAQPVADTQYNLFEHCAANTTGSNAAAFINSTAIGWHLTGGSPVNQGNTSGNTFIDCHGKTSKGITWKLENCDDNLFYWVGGAPVYDDTVASLELGSMDQDSTSLTQPIGPGAARYNMFYGAGFGQVIHARSSQTGGNSSHGNQFFGLARSNTAPLPIIETPGGGSDAATIHYWDTTGNLRINQLAILEKDIAAPAALTDHSQLWIDAIAGPLKLRDSTGAVREVLDTTSRTGDWTPVFSFLTPGDSVITHTVQIGKYQKLGSFVLIAFDVEFDTNAYTTAAGAAMVGGLPYGSSTVETSLSMSANNLTFAAGQVLRLSIPASGASIQLKIATSNAATTNAGTTQVPPSKTGVRIRGSGMYWTSVVSALRDRLEDSLDTLPTPLLDAMQIGP